MIPMVIASVTKNPLRKKCQKPMRSTASFLFSVRFVSDAALLRSLFCLVCRSSDSSIQAARLIAACDLAPYCQRIASAFSPGHDSPSNDRFSPHAGIPRMENNTLESQLLSEPCRALAISTVQTAILRWIPSVSGTLTRFPCSANKHACPICRARQGQSFHLDKATSVLRVAHVPQKPWYVILGTIIDFPCLAKCQTKEVLVSNNIRFACTQK